MEMFDIRQEGLTVNLLVIKIATSFLDHILEPTIVVLLEQVTFSPFA